AAVDLIAGEMHKRRLIDYRRPGVVPPHRMPALIGDADIVLDQFALESYGVLAVEAMAAGRVVVGRVAAPVRARLQDQVPVVEADARTLRQVLETLIVEFCDGENTDVEIARLLQVAFELREPPHEVTRECLEHLREEGLVS